MSGLLRKIAEEKRAELALRSDPPPRRADGDVPRRFRDAVRGGGVIAEIKRRSPSVAAFPNGRDPQRQARVYAENGAAAISIVTDTPRFGMTLDDVRTVRGTVALPVLVKDFVVDPRQVRDAWAAGADAVLLIARLVEPPLLRDLAEEVRGLGLTALIECHDGADVAAALDSGALAAGGGLLGVNSRDLDTLQLDLDTTRRLLRAKPDGVLMVAESGLSERNEIEEMTRLGADAFLIGGALLTAEDPGRTLRRLTGAER